MGTQEFQNKLMSLQGNLLNFAYMLTSNRDNAYDLLQDTTLKALDNESKYVDNTNFKGWVFTIMRNRIQVLKPRKVLSEPVKYRMPSTHFPMNTVYLSLCMSQVINITRLQRK